MLEHGDGVAEAEGEGLEEFPDVAAFADAGFLALVDDRVPVGDGIGVVAGPLVVAGWCLPWPDDAVLWEVVADRASDDAVACWVEVEPGSVSVSMRIYILPLKA